MRFLTEQPRWPGVSDQTRLSHLSCCCFMQNIFSLLSTSVLDCIENMYFLLEKNKKNISGFAF